MSIALFYFEADSSSSFVIQVPKDFKGESDAKNSNLPQAMTTRACFCSRLNVCQRGRDDYNSLQALLGKCAGLCKTSFAFVVGGSGLVR